jgi:hypothetical protein
MQWLGPTKKDDSAGIDPRAAAEYVFAYRIRGKKNGSMQMQLIP